MKTEVQSFQRYVQLQEAPLKTQGNYEKADSLMQKMGVKYPNDARVKVYNSNKLLPMHPLRVFYDLKKSFPVKLLTFVIMQHISLS